MKERLTMKEYITELITEYSEDLMNLLLATVSWTLFLVGADSIPDLAKTYGEIKVVVQQPNSPKNWIDHTEQFLSIISFIFSISVSIFTFVRFVVKQKKKIDSED